MTRSSASTLGSKVHSRECKDRDRKKKTWQTDRHVNQPWKRVKILAAARRN